MKKFLVSALFFSMSLNLAMAGGDDKQAYLHGALKLSPEQEAVWSDYIAKRQEATVAANKLYEKLTPQQQATFNKFNATKAAESSPAPGKSGGTGG